MKRLFFIVAASVLSVINATANAIPPALTTSSFTKFDLNFDGCQLKTREIMAKMNLEIEDHGNGTIGGFGEQSVAIVNCHLMDKTTYVQIAVSSQKEEAAQTIMHYLVSYLKTSPTTPSISPVAPGTTTYPPQ